MQQIVQSVEATLEACEIAAGMQQGGDLQHERRLRACPADSSPRATARADAGGDVGIHVVQRRAQHAAARPGSWTSASRGKARQQAPVVAAAAAGVVGDDSGGTSSRGSGRSGRAGLANRQLPRYVGKSRPWHWRIYWPSAASAEHRLGAVVVVDVRVADAERTGRWPGKLTPLYPCRMNSSVAVARMRSLDRRFAGRRSSRSRTFVGRHAIVS